MKRWAFLLVTISIALFLGVLGRAAFAQEETKVPPPYAGLTNPFAWNDASAQEAGKGLYRQSCAACHGSNGASLARANFSVPDFARRLEGRPDFYFWALSEGRLSQGMPPFKTPLTEPQRWQVLTYLRSLGVIPPSAGTPTPPTIPPTEGSSLRLMAPDLAQPGQPLTLSASLSNSQGKPVSNVPVKFFIRAELFMSGLVEIGEAVTNEQGIAAFRFTPRLTGERQIVARYGDTSSTEATTMLMVAETDQPFYRVEAGLHGSFPLPEIFVGPQSALEPGELGTAPVSGLRIPGGLPGLLFLAYLSAVLLVWCLYLRIMYQVWRIATLGQTEETNVRLIPLLGFTMMTILVTLLVVILITSPYSHSHLSH